jgi:hypothetical protein
MARLTPTQKARTLDYASVFGTDAGQRVLEDLYRSYGRRISYSKGDPYETAYREGQRSVYLSIRVMLRLDRLPEADLEEDAEL